MFCGIVVENTSKQVVGVRSDLWKMYYHLRAKAYWSGQKYRLLSDSCESGEE